MPGQMPPSWARHFRNSSSQSSLPQPQLLTNSATSPSRYYEIDHAPQLQGESPPFVFNQQPVSPYFTYPGEPSMMATPPSQRQRPQPVHAGNQTRYTQQNGGRRERSRRPSRNQAQPAPLGNREDVEDPSYESPVGLMFGRAWDRFRAAEQNRQSETFHSNTGHAHPINYAPSDENQSFANVLHPSNSTPHYEHPATAGHIDPNDPPQRVWGFTGTLPPYLGRQSGQSQQTTGQYGSPRNLMASMHADQANMQANMQTNMAAQVAQLDATHRAMALSARLTNDELRRRGHEIEAVQRRTERREMTLDEQERPSPRSSEDMRLDMSCRVCFEQVADTVLLPCRHLFMCHWCSDLRVPCGTGQRSHIPQKRNATCDMCRGLVKSRHQVFFT